ncbi:MAG TPA: S1/P1 nuclease [Candidatus Acidoferrales bacterium]|nr:S1/P1 nuclease [Candidatus Acidoferrales bacterium]
MKKFLAVLLLLAFTSAPLLAWGPKGHRMVGAIAQAHLGEAARRNIQALLGNSDLASVANWADDIKGDRPQTFGWHFVDIPKNSSGFDQARDCYQPDEKRPYTKDDHHNCAVDRIGMFLKVLADVNASQQDRVEALKFLVHFVGDIHQPFHALGEARGGNDIHVTEFGATQCGNYPCNLHFTWDVDLIEHTGRVETDYVPYLEQLIVSKNLAAKAGGTPEDWANESFRFAQQVLVKEGASIDEAYYQANIALLDERLALAGLRLAALFNESFK